MAFSDLEITVIGGGIGGLAAAIALRQRGANVVVLEQAEAIREVGAGLQISPNGLRVLAALGLDTRLAEVSCRGQAVSLRDGARGAEVARVDLTGAEPGYYFVHRADLIDLLGAAAREAGVKLRLLQKVAEVTPGAPPAISLANGDRCGGDLVVGADGLHSVLRPALNGPAEPFFTGQVAWRAVVPNVTDHPAEARVHMGPGRHVVTYPLRDGSVVNMVAVEERKGWVAEGWSHRDEAANLRAAFSGMSPELRRLMEGAEAPGLWGLFRHPVARRWHGEGVAILGDAAHPTLPFLAQGANLALEDAFVLAASLDGAPDVAAGLQRYQARRRDRAAKVIAAANGNAWKYHLRNPLIRGAAHMVLGLASRAAPGQMVKQFDWLYGYDATRGAA
ncbi:salicylate hydroxylase [Allosediminivita pacifica]|uniref:Salicylate hydroxylase n=1 Tax=Allosediminivita pacifica TaxID=1267769 RepID=A0A2T6ART7_9RHOB|nr:FAD-dependent monooxygenase [Allosediminivita pacifica]PTX46456.1 salicylate hydroxylase [Allosediminivita pacifica]